MNKIKLYSLHAILWLLLFLLNYFFFGKPGFNIDFTFNLKIWLIYLVLFYVNYSLLIPYFLFIKRYILYVLLLLVLVSGLFFIKSEIDKNLFTEMGNKERTHFMPPRSFDGSLSQMKPAQMPPPFFGKMPSVRRVIPGISQLLMIVLASISIRFIQKWQDDEKMKSEIEKEKITTELSFLKQQINPHFLFNAINNIYSLSLSDRPSTSEAILKLSSILRYMLYETDKKFVALRNEIQVIEDYIELQKLRITEKVHLTYRVKGNSETYSIVPLLLIPLIENAFKHGIDNINNSIIDIFIEIENDMLNIRIKNSLVPKPEKDSTESGIGIKNIRRRLELFYPQAHSFKTDIIDDCFLVHLSLNLEQ
jgi:two-component system, LytTR family, sensor kinase